MSRLVSELESVLQNMLAEHTKLLGHVESHQVAIRSMDLKAMDAAGAQQEACRRRIGALDRQRSSIASQLARTMKIDPGPGGLRLSRLAELHPPRRDPLLALRKELREVADAVSEKTKVGGRVAVAVLGHLNAAMRLFAGAVERAGLYTKTGAPKLSQRIGMMEAVG